MKRRVWLVLIAILLMLLVGFIILNKNKEDFIDYSISENYLDISYGKDNSPIEMFLFMDYTCVHCKNFLINTFPKVKQEYIDKGLLKFNIKLLSFSNNVNVINAYKMAVCLNQYGDFTELNKLLLYETDAIFSKQFVEVYDELIERNTTFASCMYSGASEDYLQENAYSFVKNKFTSTPTFVINKRVFKGYRDFINFSEIIEEELLKLE